MTNESIFLIGVMLKNMAESTKNGCCRLKMKVTNSHFINRQVINISSAVVNNTEIIGLVGSMVLFIHCLFTISFSTSQKLLTRFSSNYTVGHNLGNLICNCI